MSDLQHNDEDQGFYFDKKNQSESEIEEIERIPVKKDAFAKMKKRRIRKIDRPIRKKKDQKEDKLQKIGEVRANNIIRQMEKAYQEDLKAIQNRQRAIHKLVYFDSLSKQLKNVYVCQKFLEYNGLAEFERWMSKSTKGYEPPFQLRKSLMELLLSMRIRAEHIVRALELQKIIQHAKRSTFKELRDLSDAIMVKWGQITYEDDE